MLIITFFSSQSLRELSTEPMPAAAAGRYVSWLADVSFVNNIRVWNATTRERVLV